MSKLFAITAVLVVMFFGCQDPFSRPEAKADLYLQIELETPQAFQAVDSGTRLITEDVHFLLITLEAHDYPTTIKSIGLNLNDEGMMEGFVQFPSLPAGRLYTITAQARDLHPINPDSRVLYEATSAIRLEPDVVNEMTLHLLPSEEIITPLVDGWVHYLEIPAKGIQFFDLQMPLAEVYQYKDTETSLDRKFYVFGSQGELLNPEGAVQSMVSPAPDSSQLFAIYNASDSPMGFPMMVHDPFTSADFTPPPAPGGLSGRELIDGMMEITWSQPTDLSDVSGYLLFEEVSGWELEIEDPTVTSQIYDMSGQATYTFYLFSYDSVGNFCETPAELQGNYSGDLEPPAPVGGLSANITAMTIVLNWSPSPEPDLGTYVVEDTDTGNPLATPTANFFYYEAPDYGYYNFQVRAMDIHGNQSEPSLLEVPLIEPIDPTTITVDRTNTSITITWDDPAFLSAGTIVVNLNGTDHVVALGVQELILPWSDATDDYTLEFYALDASSNSSEPTILTSIADTTPPGAVSDVITTAYEDGIYVEWIDPSDPDLAQITFDDGMNVYSIPLGQESHWLDVLPSQTPAQINFTIQTQDYSGNSTDYLGSATPLADTTAPGEVILLTPAITTNSITINWSDPFDSDLDHILIDDGSNQYSVSVGVETYTFVGLSGSQTINILLQTVDQAGNASLGISDSYTTTGDDTTAPVNPSDINPDTGYQYVGHGGFVGALGVRLQFTPPSLNPGDGSYDPSYAGARSSIHHYPFTIVDPLTPSVDPSDTVNQPMFDSIETTSNTQTELTIGGLTEGSTYYATLIFFDDAGNESGLWNSAPFIYYSTPQALNLTLVDLGSGPMISLDSGNSILDRSDGDVILLSVDAPENYNDYEWYLDTLDNPIFPGASDISVDSSSLSLGTHTILFIGEDRMGIPLSSTFDFEVIQ